MMFEDNYASVLAYGSASVDTREDINYVKERDDTLGESLYVYISYTTEERTMNARRLH